LYHVLYKNKALDRYFSRAKTRKTNRNWSYKGVESRLKRYIGQGIKTRRELSTKSTKLYSLANSYGLLDLYLPDTKNIYTWDMVECVFAVHAEGDIRDIHTNFRGFYNKARNEDWIQELCIKYRIKRSKGMYYGIIK
jgi:hypothetical protein